MPVCAKCGNLGGLDIRVCININIYIHIVEYLEPTDLCLWMVDTFHFIGKIFQHMYHSDMVHKLIVAV